ncbi:MAG: LPS assembly lipoprotein LptE [Candidatus Methylacidiphilales bacterium]
MSTRNTLVTLFLGFALLTSCAGYRVGNIPYSEMKGVKRIYVPVVHNKTFEPGLQVATTNAVLRRIDQDGTYQSGRLKESDATLEITLTQYRREALRRARDNSLVTEEYKLILTAEVTLINHLTGQKFLDKVLVTGDTSIYVNENRFQENERQAIPLATEALAYEIVRQITEGW